MLFSSRPFLMANSWHAGDNHVVEEHTIVGGTGRFAGASGSFTLDRLVQPVGTTPTSASVGTVDWTIVIHQPNTKRSNLC